MFFIILAALVLCANSGHIYSHDVIISPNNKNSQSNITLIFTPETTLATTDYLRLIFPFELSSIQGTYWDIYTDCSDAQPSTNIASITESNLPDDTNTFFLQFYNGKDQTEPANLFGNVTYILRIIATPVDSGNSDLTLPVQIFTISNNSTNWIIYDANTAAGLINLADAYPNSLIASLSIPYSQTNSKILGANYTAIIEITPTIAVENQGRIDIQLTNPAFTILSCDSATKQEQDDIQEIAVNFQQIASNSIRAIILEPLPANNGEIYSFTCTIQNPTKSALSSIKAQSRMAFAETIVEAGSSPLVLEAALLASSDATAFWDEDYHSVQLAWGYQASTSTALSIFSLYKDASASEVWYQSMKTTFKPRTSVTSTDKLQVLVSTLNDAGFRVLASTIYHNLPDYSATEKVSCALVTQGYITCSNVGQLQAQQYYVAFRFAVLSITGLTTAPDFGKVQVQTQTSSSPLTLISLSQTTLANQEIGTNVPLFTTGGSQGVIAYANSSTTVRDYVSTDEDITLNLRFKYFTSQIIPLVLTEADMGIEFYTSNALPSVTSPTCSIANLTEGVDIDTANCAVTTSTAGYTKLSFRIVQLLNNATDSAAAALFLATPNDGTISFSTLRFSSSDVSSLSYINENIYDYYARWVQGYDSSNIPSLSTAQGSSAFFFNSLVYRSGGLADVQAGASFFIASQTSGGIGNAGTDFPTLIRITGSLSATEQTTTDKLLVFFNNLEPLNTDTPCFGPSDIQCSYSANGQIENTGTNDLTDYTGARRMEIKTDFTNSFNIYIPVQTIATYSTIGFFITAVSAENDTTTGREYLLTQYIKRIDATTYTATITGDSVPIDDPSTSTPKIVIPNNAGAGDLIDTYISNAVTTYATTANSGTNVGAAYAYCAKYNFTVSDSFAFTALTGSNQETSSCVRVQYTSAWNQEVICEVCPVDTTMPPSGNLPVTNFKLPTLTGADYCGSVYVVGSSNGALVKAASDNQTDALTPFKLASHSITFTPENIRADSKNILGVFSFTPTFYMPQNISIVLTPASPSSSFLMTPLSAFGCKILSVDNGACSITGNDTYIQINATSSTATWPVVDHSIQFMVDSEADSITEDTTINYEATIYVDGVSTFSAIHDTSDTAQYTIDIEPSGSINLTQASYLFANEGARTVVFISFEVPNDTYVYQGQQLIFDIGSIATENSGETPSCVVRDQSTSQISTSFTSCNVTDLTSIIVIPKEQTTGNFTLELGFLKAPASSADDTNITLKLISIDGVTTVATSPNLTMPVTYTSAQSTTPSSFVAYNRLYSNPGDVAEISFTMKPSVQSISLKSQVYVYFPSYYSPKLGYKNIWCTANDLPLTCSVIRSRVLNFASFPVTVKTGSTVVIKVYGVVTPTVPVPAQTLFIAMDNDLNMDQLVEYAEVNDIASIPYTSRPLQIHDFFASTTVIRDAADYSIIFTTDLDGVKANTIIALDFPDRFGNTLRGQQGPTVFISRTGSKLGTEVQTISFGSRFKITLPITLDPQTSYTFRVKSVVNPDYPTCGMDRPMFIIANSDETAAKYRTIPATWNGQLIDYLANPNLKTLSMTDINGSVLTNITLSVGTYSQEIRIVPPNNESFNSEITFATTTNDVTLLPAILTAVRGASYLSFRVGVPLDFTAQTVLLTFSKDESSIYQVYSPLPHLELTFTNTLINTIPTPPISIMKGGKSLLYEWKLDDLGIIPYTDLSITAKINNKDSSPLSIVNKTKITFTPDSPSGGFIFALDSGADASDPPSFTLSLSGTDASMYKLESTQVVVTVAEPNDQAPVLNNLVIPQNYAPTRQLVTVNVDQSVSLYWYIAVQNNLETSDCSTIISTYQAGTQYDSLSGKQDQYGALYLYNANQDYDFIISNLVSNQAYSFILCMENQLAHISSVTGSFTTMNNQATLDLVTIKFSDDINRNQLTSILCFFNQELQLPNLNVVAMDGTSCEVPSAFNSFSEFDYSKIVLYIYGERRSDQTSQTTAQLKKYVKIITQQTTSTFLTDFNQAFSGANILDTFTSITLETDVTYASPVLVSGNPSISADATSLVLSGLALKSGEGVFYGIADVSTDATPSIAQVRTMTNVNDIYVSGDATLYKSGSVSLIFTGLTPSTKYTIYYYGTSEDRTQYAETTEMKAVDVYTLYGALLEGKVVFVLITAFCMLIL